GQAVMNVLAGGDQEEVAGTLARAAGLEVFGNEELRDVAAGAVPRALHVPAEITPRDDGQVGRDFPRVVVERASVLPLVREAKVRRRRNVEDLILRLRVGLGQ